MADDLGWGDTGYNGNKVIQTPNIDQMAGEGVQFNRFYAAAPVGAPTCASVLTGRNPYRTGILNEKLGALRPEEVTLPELLIDEGYVTGHFGKWHPGRLNAVGESDSSEKAGCEKTCTAPLLHGFQVAFTTGSRALTWKPLKKMDDKAAAWERKYFREDEHYQHCGHGYWDMEENKGADKTGSDDNRLIMNRVLQFVEWSVNQRQPFLAVVWFQAPHKLGGPNSEGWETRGGQDAEMRHYAGFINAMDHQVGRLRRYLTKRNIDDNTMIWFCSDNGPEVNSCGDTGGFLERKYSLHEGGIRVPGIMVWPNVVKVPFQTDIPCVTSDYLPTIAEVLDIEPSKLPYQIDGESLLPLLKREKRFRNRPIIFCYENQLCYSGNRYKLYVKNGMPVFYDIVNDPFEEHPIVKSEELWPLKEHLDHFLVSLQYSFEGKEYGTISYENRGYKWVNPYTIRKD